MTPMLSAHRQCFTALVILDTRVHIFSQDGINFNHAHGDFVFRRGIGVVMFHQWKKVNQGEWAEAVEKGRLVAACKSARPDRQRGP